MAEQEKPNGHAKSFPAIDHPSRRIIVLQSHILRMHNDLLTFAVNLHRAIKHLDDRLNCIEKIIEARNEGHLPS